ncbi:MAG: UDP-N-acetylglucosamine 2-epimerase [Bacillota bacterium]
MVKKGPDVRKIAVFTATRAEYGLLRPIIERINASPRLELSLVVAGTHFSPWHGRTEQEIRADGVRIAAAINNAPESDTPGALVLSVGLGLLEIAAYFTERVPDLILVVGDRYDLFVPMVGGILHRVPIAHIGGGETTEGVLDEQVRHAVSKMSHLHFAGTVEYARNLRRMGEEAWRIHLVGAPGVENIRKQRVMTTKGLKKTFDIDVSRPTLLITYHPETLTGKENPAQEVAVLIDALKEFSDYQQVVTYPGAEAGFHAVIEAWKRYAVENSNVKLYQSLGSQGYLGVMRYASAVVGNSSSGIIEAPSFRVPAVNIGNRQKGRVRAESIIDVPCRKEEIIAGLHKALEDRDFRRLVKRVRNPYDPHGDGNVSGRIVSVLESVPIDRRLLEKKLDFPTEEELCKWP